MHRTADGLPYDVVVVGAGFPRAHGLKPTASTLNMRAFGAPYCTVKLFWVVPNGEYLLTVGILGVGFGGCRGSNHE